MSDHTDTIVVDVEPQAEIVPGVIHPGASEELVRDQIAALLREREMNEAKGLPVDEIDEQLKAYGHNGAHPAKRAARRA